MSKAEGWLRKAQSETLLKGERGLTQSKISERNRFLNFSSSRPARARKVNVTLRHASARPFNSLTLSREVFSSRFSPIIAISLTSYSNS